ncbi:LON peptidase substrate-binding domain-containing protein [Sulfobacillus harzensis]|uniref:Peptidase S16 n=1 Tax=Sulfobacillus harzensis TaxID=2729629 RepID=A0A7Y0L0J2_9FIRM|nr:LON peptidase substrate-binding domain-containing protein [Sulfobacillus harzensis]NMP20803.1 peptidase S16 [Sulfobacillus harzensis]
MPTRDTFSMPLLPVPQVVFPGIITQMPVRPRAAGASARLAAAQDHSLVFALMRPDREPSTVATTGRVLEMEESPEGWQITVAGIQRAQVLSYRHQGNSLIGQFRYANDVEESIPPLLREEAWALASELWAMLNLSGPPANLPRTAPLLSYWIAAHVPLSASTQQELLEVPSTRGRLAKEISLMRTLLDGLRAEHSS